MANLTSKSVVESTVDLLTGNTDAGSRVTAWRTLPVQDADLPCLAVYVLRTGEQARSENRPIYAVTSTVVVDAHVKAADETWAESLDTLTDQIKRLLLTDDTWAGQFRDIDRVDTTVEFDVGADYRRAIAHVEIACTHDVTYEPLSSTAVDLGLVHYTDQTLPPEEMEARTAPEEEV